MTIDRYMIEVVVLWLSSRTATVCLLTVTQKLFDISGQVHSAQAAAHIDELYEQVSNIV